MPATNRQYVVCCSAWCQGWLWADRCAKVGQCKQCGTAWEASLRKAGLKAPTAKASKAEWPTLGEAARWKSQSPVKARARGIPKDIQAALSGAWDGLEPQLQQALQEAGFKPKVPEKTEPDLMQLLQQHAGELPEAVRAAIAVPEPPAPSPTEVGLEAADRYKQAVGKLRDLGHRKLQLQGKIEVAKKGLRTMLDELKALQEAIGEAQASVDDLGRDYQEKVLTQASDLKTVQEQVQDALTEVGLQIPEDQVQRLQEALESQAKRRRKVEPAELPPGLGGTPQLQSEPSSKEVPQATPGEDRRTRSRTPPGGKQEGAKE